MKSTYFTIHPGKNPPQNGCRLTSVYFESTGFTSSTLPIQPDFSQNQPAAITLNTGSPRTLHQYSFQSLSRIDAIEECRRGCQDIEALPTSHMTTPYP